MFNGATAKECKFNISGGTIDNYLPQSKIDAANDGQSVSAEFLFRIDDKGVTQAEFKGNVVFQDNSNLLNAAFRAGNQAPNKDFYDYIYNSRLIILTSYKSTYSDGITALPLAILPQN